MATERNGSGSGGAGQPGEGRAGAGQVPRLRCYANGLAAGFSLSEIELRFGQRFGPGEEFGVHTWIVTSPVHLVTFHRVIGEAIAAYQSRYGAIPEDAPQAGAPGG